MRASDADRDDAAERLAAALIEGRLDLTEYARRLDLAMSAVVLGDLEPLTADLPEPTIPLPPHQTVPAARPSGEDVARREWADEWRWWLGGAVIMTGIWAVTSVVGGVLLPFWPLVPLGIWAAILVAAVIWPDEHSGRRG
ncbi:DUF1707 SHOCT-like domain-containing protein [Marinitenerispora sediminis]|uniref:DUF1707 domain-containing protein n=1 Tax=Marinitenerispora sediminis TaxID=1931232 RepID=A0A368T6X0_9ACTN|nr:DUF1707 domain-containing protein [Marinitenerispora sediminis]RCV50666.1 hypothetical protein DEF28_17480 [Marinitenerispora sediminis]RCV56216.1 hypothetical protein DEF23_13045 [Marinitenerispora sediminis]RCV59447.1 hypothetical protein DEF24_09715 [Marinitenerispora sediminis]